MQTSFEIRVRGLLTVICGVFLVVFLGYVALWMRSPVSDGGIAHSRFTGTPEQQLLVFGLVGVIILFGFVAFITGLFSLVLGRRNKWFVRIVVGLGVIIFIGFCSVFWVFDR